MFLFLIFTIGLSRSFFYIFNLESDQPEIIKYLNLSPYPIAFIHRTFFASKSITVSWETDSQVIDPKANRYFYKNRSNYRFFMFGLDLNKKDFHSVVNYLYCQHPDEIKLNLIKKNPKIITITYHFINLPEHFIHECQY